MFHPGRLPQKQFTLWGTIWILTNQRGPGIICCISLSFVPGPHGRNGGPSGSTKLLLLLLCSARWGLLYSIPCHRGSTWCKPNSCGDERICGNDWCCSLRLPEPDKTISLRVGNSLLLLWIWLMLSRISSLGLSLCCRCISSCRL